MNATTPEPYALARRGLPLPAARHAPARGAWLPSAARNAAAVADAPVTKPEPIGAEAPWWEEAAEWIPIADAKSRIDAKDEPEENSKKRSEDASTALDIALASIANRQADIAPRQTQDPVIGKAQVDSAHARRSRTPDADSPIASPNALATHSSAASPMPQPARHIDIARETDIARTRREAPKIQEVSRSIDPMPKVVRIPIPALEPNPRRDPRTTIESMHTPDASIVSASRNIDAIRPPSVIRVEPIATQALATPLPTMGAPMPTAVNPRATTTTALAELSSRAESRAPQLQIDRVSIDVHAAPPSPVANTATALKSADVAQVASPARGYRNPWASYHLRRD